MLQRLRSKKLAVFDFANLNGFCRVARTSRHFGYVFVSIPKSGGNSMRAALIRSESLINNKLLHIPEYTSGLENDYFYRYNIDLDNVRYLLKGVKRGPIVSMVRNPFSRALSGYNEKIVKTYRMLAGDPEVPMEKKSQRLRRLKELGLPLNRMVSFEEYLEALKDMPPAVADQHFAPQSYLMGVGRIPYDIIGHLEAYERDMDRISLALFGNENVWRTAETRSGGQRQINYKGGGAIDKIMVQYTARSADIVRQYYEKDFLYFDYSLDLDEAASAPAPISKSEHKLHIPWTALATVASELAIKNVLIPRMRN